ncbi:MAG: restriction endonuclease subunit S [Woeseiaceae bacterium]
MAEVEKLITNNIDIWSSSIKAKPTVGRGSSKKFELFGIKKLRELILELAVCGLLVPQDRNDEPANVLFEKIKEEKTKKTKSLPEIIGKEEPFQLPNGWVFARFIDVLDFSGGSQPPKSTFSEEKLDGYVQLIQIRDLGPKPQPVYVPEDTVTKLCTSNDIMIGRYGASVGKVFWGKDGAYNVALIKLHNDTKVFFNAFLYNLMLSPIGKSFFTGISRSAQAGFSKDDIAPKVIPIPPFAEQHRIVAKVDELMALCDQLEQQTEASISAHQTLVQTLLDTLTKTSKRDGFNQAWTRIAENFDTLFTTEWSIDQLKRTIIQLAVMGKLVPQNQNDEPAAVLLKKLAIEKKQLFKNKIIKKPQILDEINVQDKPFDLPNGWEWVRFGLLFKSFSNGLYKPAKFYTDNGVVSLRMYNIQNGLVSFDGVRRVEVESKELEQFLLEKDDLLINRVNSKELVGKTAIIPSFPEPLLYESMNMRAKPFNRYVSSHYLNLFMMTNLAKESISSFAKEAVGQASINQAQVGSIKTPLPPLAEQERIVVKVDVLMEICKQLKSNIIEAQTTQQYLADAITEKTIN